LEMETFLFSNEMYIEEICLLFTVLNYIEIFTTQVFQKIKKKRKFWIHFFIRNIMTNSSLIY
jgi:hypothetical protein